MKTPTLEEVKAYFKNAKEVRLCNSNTIIKLTTRNFKYNNCGGINEYSENDEDLISNTDFHCVWYNGYAEIISYKETFEYLEEVEVSDDGVNWECGNYCCILPDNSYVVWLEYRKEALGYNKIRKLNAERTQAIETIKQLMSKHKIYMYEINKL